MPLWVFALLLIGVCTAYYVIILAEKHENKVIKQMGYLIGTIGIATIVFSALLKLYYAFDAICKL